MDTKCYSLLDLNTLIGWELRNALPETYWVQAELVDVRERGKVCYLDLAQTEQGKKVAHAQGTIWENTYKWLKPYFEKTTKRPFADGIKILIQVKVEFHPVFGLALDVKDIDPVYTMGDLVKKRLEILEKLKQFGVLNMNKELKMPLLPQRIAIVSSPTAAGYQDFCNQLHNNPQGFAFFTRLFPALMQGNNIETSILDALDEINKQADNFDVVVIIRGGGSTMDLVDFDNLNLAQACAQFPLPIITGIGHQRDDTVLDIVAHTKVKTPTAAADFLIQRVMQAEKVLLDLSDKLCRILSDKISSKYKLVENLQAGVVKCVSQSLCDAVKKIRLLGMRVYQRSSILVGTQRSSLPLLQQVKDKANNLVMKKRSALDEIPNPITVTLGRLAQEATILKGIGNTIGEKIHNIQRLNRYQLIVIGHKCQNAYQKIGQAPIPTLSSIITKVSDVMIAQQSVLSALPDLRSVVVNRLSQDSKSLKRQAGIIFYKAYSVRLLQWAVVNKIEVQLKEKAMRWLFQQQREVDLLKQKARDASPQRILSCGYSLTLKNGKLVTSASMLSSGDKLTTWFKHGQINSIVE